MKTLRVKKTYDVYSSENGSEWYHRTTTIDPQFIEFLNSIDEVLYWDVDIKNDDINKIMNLRDSKTVIISP